MFRPPEAETCRLIIKIPYISCNKLFSNSCLVFNLNYYKFVVLDVHTLLFSIRYYFITMRTLPIFSPASEPVVSESTLMSRLQHFPISILYLLYLGL